jgi:phage terminase large subunit GpA-like protein
MSEEFATAPEGLVAIEMMVERLNKLWNPPPQVLPSEWARKNLWLTQGARKGFCVPDPYQIEIMDAVARPGVRKLTFLKPVQIGYTTILQAIFGWAVDLYAHQVLLVQPSQPTAKKFARDRIDPVIEHAPGLASRLVIPGKSTPGSTIRDKMFTNGGSLFVAAAKAPKELRMFSASLILLDERSTFEVTVGSEGDPAKIAEARGEVFEDLVLFQGSTVVLSRGKDPIEQDYLESSMAKYFVPCPQCNGLSTLPWRDEQGRHRLIYELDGNRKVVKDSVRYACIHCDTDITETWKVKMVEAGNWIHARPEITDHLGYHTTSLMSVVKNNWDELAQKWADAQGNSSRLKSFLTLNLAETWLEPGSQLDSASLLGRLDHSMVRRQVPEGAGVVVCFTDMQKTWLEGSIWAFGDGMEAWLVDWFRADGDTSQGEVWEDLDAWLLEPIHHANGKVAALDLALVDSGYNSGTVYSFVMPRQNAKRRVYASKGSEKITAVGLAREGVSRKARVRLFNIATDAAKKVAMGMLNQRLPEGETRRPGYVHIPGWVTEEFIKGLASERHEEFQDPKTGVTKQRWTEIEDRNEPWDCFVGSVAAVWILQNLLQPGRYRDLAALAAEVSEVKPKTEAKEAPPVPQRMGGGGLGGLGGGGLGGGMFRGGL